MCILEFTAQMASLCVWPLALSQPPPHPCCAQMCFSPLLPPKRHPSFGCSSFHTSPICTDNQTVIHLFTFSCVSLKLIEDLNFSSSATAELTQLLLDTIKKRGQSALCLQSDKQWALASSFH